MTNSHAFNGFADILDRIKNEQAGALEQFISQMQAGSTGLSPEMTSAKEDDRNREAMAAALAEFSRTHGGKLFLDALAAATVHRAVAPIMADMTNDHVLRLAAFREGENHIAWKIFELLAIGLGNDNPPNREAF